MYISTDKAASILNLSADELMFMALTENRIPVEIDQESMTWQFNLDHVVELKQALEAQAAAAEAARQEEATEASE